MRNITIALIALLLLIVGYGFGVRHMSETHAAIDAQNDATTQTLVSACETAQMVGDEYYGKWLLAESNVTTLTISLGTSLDAITAEGYEVLVSDEGTVTVTVSKPALRVVTPEVSRSAPVRAPAVPSRVEQWRDEVRGRAESPGRVERVLGSQGAVDNVQGIQRQPVSLQRSISRLIPVRIVVGQRSESAQCGMEHTALRQGAR